LQNDFNFVAPFYDFLAGLVFGKSIKNSQTWLLPFIPEKANVLIIGGGTGWILTEMLDRVKPGKIVYLEASENMLERSQKRYAQMVKKDAAEVEFRLGTQTTLAPTETFDVIFTGFLLDLFEPETLENLIQQLYSHLKPTGLWLLADFYPQNATVFGQKSLLQTMVWFFKLTANLQTNQLPDLEKAFSRFPLALQQECFFYKDLIRSAVYRKVVV
jgi:tRNA (cmo5U34)-methyltransferase